MPEICVVCNILNSQMINIFQHPKELGFKLEFVLGYQAQENDFLCYTCYDELIIAFNFKQKCLQSNLNRPKVRTTDRVECNTLEKDYLKYSSSLLEIKIEPNFELDESANVSTALRDDESGNCYKRYFKREKSVDINSGADEEALDEKNLYQPELKDHEHATTSKASENQILRQKCHRKR